MDNLITSLGLMSGTSLDGIDASIIRSDGEDKIEIIENRFKIYPGRFRNKLDSYIKNINSKEDILKSKEEYDKIEKELTLLHANISSQISKETKQKLDLVGFHGHTIIHRPKLNFSFQMGNPNLLSNILKTKIIFNFRKKDIENGGEGAPLTPIYHYCLSKKLNLNTPLLFLNIGGISNITYLDKEKLIAKDIGPGNVLIDEYLNKTKNLNYDKDGKIAESGNIDRNLINQFIEHEIYNSNNNHSLERKDFDFNFVKGLQYEDAVATLTYFTALIISNYINKKFKDNLQIIICGGGRKNKILFKHIENLTKKNIKKVDQYKIDGDFIESQAFAYLAIRSHLKKNISFPLTTGVVKPITGGEEFYNC